MTDPITMLVDLLERQVDDDEKTIELLAAQHAEMNHCKGCKCSQVLESQRTYQRNSREGIAAIRAKLLGK